VAEGTRLESAHTRKGIGGSNPSLSAIFPSQETSDSMSDDAPDSRPKELCTILHVNSEFAIENK
jgi:hypothetical protein